MKRIIAFFTVAGAAVLLFSGTSLAVNVTTYDQFQANLLLGNNVEITPSDIIKANSNALTIGIIALVTITGNGRVIELNKVGNMFSTTAANITVTMTSFTVHNGSYTQNGGAINMTGANSRLVVGGTANLNSNFSAASGGAISAENNSILTFSGTTNLNNNTANNSGGAISLTSGATANFSATALNAANNRVVSGNGGFLSAVGAGAITFGEAIFTNNTAASTTGVNGFGGVIYSDGGTAINFTKDVSFLNNSAYSAGAMYIINGTTATFSGANTLFQGNQSYDAVGALLVRDGSRVVFNGANTVFRNNYMTNNRYGTGAVDIASNSSADFRGTSLIAQGNNAGAGGWGGFMWSDSSTVLFGNVLIGGNSASDGNSAYYGGGIYAGNSNIMTFTGTSTLFRNNKSSVDGGAIYVTTSSAVTFATAGSTVAFRNNTATGKGGAIAMKELSNVVFNGAGAYFNENSAAFGGAISIEGGSTLNIANGNFVSNHANMAGGAIYLRGDNSTKLSVLRSNTVSTGDGRTIFRGNMAQGERNAVYLDDYSSAYFTAAANTSIEMFDSITGSTNSTTYFEFSGAGDFNLHGMFDTLDLNSNGKFNLKAGSIMNASTVNNAAGARFDMQNGVSDTARMKTLNNSGTLAFDVLPGSNDKIITGGLNIVNATSVLEVKADHMTDTKFRKRIYKLINYENYTGTFDTVNILSPSAPASYYVGYGDAYANWVTLAMLGSQSATEFGKISGETFNQKEAADALDKISATAANNDPWDLALAEIETYDDDGIKNILSHLAGYFLANVIRNAAADSPNNEIYDRIKNHCVEGHVISNGFWAQARGGIETFYENGNSVGDYKDTSAGIMAGYDRFMENINLMLGIYGRFNSDSIEQGRNKADGTKTGAGVYGGYIKENWELKALTLAGFDSFDTKRYIPLTSVTAAGEIKTVTLSLDFEGALKFDMTFNTKFRPYAGIEFANSSYSGFTESGAGIYNLDVEGGNYLRSSGRIGAGIQYEENIWSFYANLEGKLLFSGTEPEIESVFEGTNASFKTKGAEEGALEFGGGLGGAVRLSESLKLFANANVYRADKYQNIYGNIGLRYTFCNPFAVKYKPLPPVTAPVFEPIVYVEPPLEPEPAMQKSEDIDMYNESVVEEQKLEAMKRREMPMLRSYSMNMASFAVGKSTLLEAARKDIAREAEEIKQFVFKRIIIEGHTDSTGSGNLNKKLSNARAKAVYDEFAFHGIAEDKMMYIGFGATMPRDTNRTAEGRSSNRRVEIFVE